MYLIKHAESLEPNQFSENGIPFSPTPYHEA